MRVSPDYNLSKLNPELARQWNPTNNGQLTSFEVTPGSSKKVWWVCSHGHEWKATVHSRARRGRGCPKCRYENQGEILRKAAVKRSGSLALKYPELVKEWHPTKNGELTPHDMTSGSGVKVWWKCNKGHEWKAEVKSRGRRGLGCPYCSGQMAGEDNNLAVKYPDLAKEWHPTKNRELTPDQVTPGSGTKVWWICERGHEWNTQIRYRTKSGTGCPYCKPKTSRLELRIYCELKAIFSDVRWRKKIDGIECDIYLPKYKFGLELDSYYYHVEREKWDRKKGKVFLKQGIEVFHIRDERLGQIAPTDIFYRMGERNLPVIKRLLKNLLVHTSFTHEDELKISDYLKLNQLQNTQEYKEILSLLPSPPFEESLAHLYPQLLSEWNYEKNMPIKPTMATPGSGLTVWWRCKRGHEWDARIVDRAPKGSNCPICRYINQSARIRKTIVKTRGSVADKFPHLVKEWHPTKNGTLTPYDITPGSDRKVWWICNRGHEWDASVSHRVSGRRCPKCSYEKRGAIYRKAVVKRRGSLSTKYPNLTKEWHPTRNVELTPKDVTPGSNRKAWWICSYGHEWEATINNRTGRGSGCPKCYIERRRSK